MKRPLFAVGAVLLVYVMVGMSAFAYASEQPTQPPSQTRLEIALGVCCQGRVANGKTIPPFAGSINIHAIPVTEQGDYLYDEKIYWQIQSTRDAGDRFLWDNNNSTVTAIEFADSLVRRTITITASLYYDRSIYDTFRFTFDPRQPTITATNTYEVYFTQGVEQEALITVDTQNLPDGIYTGSIRWLPDGMHVVGWSETSVYEIDDLDYMIAVAAGETAEGRLVRSVYGEIEIINGTGAFTLISDHTFGDNARQGNYNFGLSLENVWFDSTFRVVIKPVLTDIQFIIHQYAGLPGKGNVEIWPRLYCMYGRSDWDHHQLMRLIDWTVTGMAEGDTFYIDDEFRQWKYLYVGPSTEKRTIEVTATASNNPAVYATVTVYIDADFEFTPTEINLHRDWGVITGIDFITLDDYANNMANIRAFTSDGFANHVMELGDLVFTVEGADADDAFFVGVEEAVFWPSQNQTIRLVTITATAVGHPAVYDYVNILVVPSRDYLPNIYIASIDDRAVTLHANNISDGFHQIYMNIRYTEGWTNHLYLFIWTDHLLMEWEYSETIEFTDGVGVITLISDDDTAIADLRSHLLHLYWEAWIEEFDVTASGLEQFDLRDSLSH